MTALQVGTVYACCNIISGAFASLPLNVYEHIVKAGRNGKKKATTHPLWNLLHNEPNEEMTTFTFLKTMMLHDLLWGNAFAEIQRDNSTQIIGLWPRNPARTRAIRLIKPMMLEGDVLQAGTLLYETTEQLMSSNPGISDQKDNLQLGARRLILAEDMVHVPGLSLDGRVGQGTVWLARQIIGLALATEKYGAKFFGNGARPAGVLTIPSAMEEKAVENLRRSWAEAHGGENKWKVAVLEQGVKFEKIAATPEEGQMLGTRQYERAEICAVFNVPLHMVAASEKSGKSNVEQSSLEFVQYCLMPWMTAWQMELRRKLFPKMGRTANQFFPGFDKQHLIYPDADSRGKYYASGRQWGYLTKNDIREMEGLNPDESGAGDVYTVQVNMQNDAALIPGGASDGKKPPAPKPTKPAVLPGQLPDMPGNQPAVPAAPAPAKKAPGKIKQVKKRSLCVACETGECGEHRDAESAPVPAYVLRHGTTVANEEGLYRGWKPYPLDDQGKQNANEAGEYLKGMGIKRIITSSLERHQETAQIVSSILGNIPISVDEGFRTLNVGVFAGKPRDKYGDELEWYIDHPDEAIPGGESLNDFVDRNHAAFLAVAIANKASGPILIITSRSNIANELAALEETSLTEDGVAACEPGGVYKLVGNKIELVFGEEASADSLGS